MLLKFDSNCLRHCIFSTSSLFHLSLCSVCRDLAICDLCTARTIFFTFYLSQQRSTPSDGNFTDNALNYLTITLNWTVNEHLIQSLRNKRNLWVLEFSLMIFSNHLRSTCSSSISCSNRNSLTHDPQIYKVSLIDSRKRCTRNPKNIPKESPF